MDKKIKVLITLGVLLLLGVGFYLVSYAITKYTGYSITGKIVYSKQEQREIGMCLNEKGIVFYCTSMSLYCMRQRKLLGEAFEFIEYVDCDEIENIEECGGLSMPAWKINNNIYYGIRDLKRLSDSVGCKVR
jgi:hypothetical protein